MWVALAAQSFLLVWIALGPTVNTANAVAGGLSLMFTLAFTRLVLSLEPTARLDVYLRLSLLGMAVGWLAALVAEGAKGPLAALAAGGTGRDATGLIVNASTVSFLSLPAVLALLTLSRYSGFARTTQLLAACGAAFGSVLLLITGSRSTLVALACGAIFGVLASGRTLSRAKLIALGGAFVMVWLILLVALAVIDDPSVASRREIWRVVLRELESSPLAGLGYGALPLAGLRITQERVRHAHDTALQTYSDFGLLGLLVVLGWFAASCLAAGRLAMQEAPAPRTLGRGSLAVLIAYAVLGLTESVLSGVIDVGGMTLTVLSPVAVLVLTAPWEVKVRPLPDRRRASDQPRALPSSSRREEDPP